MRLLSEQVSNIRLRPRPERNIGVAGCDGKLPAHGGCMRKLSIFVLLCVSLAGAAKAQSDVPVASSEPTVSYFIPGFGYGNFDPGTTYEQAVQNICDDPETVTKYPAVACGAAPAGASQSNEAAATGDTVNGSASTDPGEDGDKEKALSASLGGSVIAGLLAFGVYALAGGSKSARKSRRFAAMWLAACIFMGLMPVFSNLLLWGHVSDSAAGKFFGGLFGAPLMAGLGYLYGAHKENRERAEKRSGLAEPNAKRAAAASSHLNVSPAARPMEEASGRRAPVEMVSPLKSEDPFVIAGEELLSGNMDAGAWARALVEGEGIEDKVRASYVRLRLNQLSQLESSSGDTSNAEDINAQALRNHGFQIERIADRWDVRDPRDGQLIFMQTSAFVAFARQRLRELQA